MKRRQILGPALLVAFGLCASPVWADGLVRDGVGPISAGRGGTNQGFADNSAIILDNPGAMVNVAGNGLGEAGVDTVTPQVDYSNTNNGVVTKVRPLPLPVLGYIRKSDDGQWAYGIGAFVPAGFGASYGVMQSNNALLGSNLYRSIGGMGKILPGLSYRATERLSVGLTVGLAFSDVELHGPFYFQTGALAGVPAIINEQGFGVAPTGSVGMQYLLSEDTVLGATYTEQTNFNLNGGLSANIPGGPPGGVDFDSKLHMKWPRSVAFGLKHDLCPHRRVSADVIWYDWAHAFDQINIQLNNPQPAILPPTTNDVFPLHWTNSVSLRLGYELLPTDVDIFRMGYTYHGSPVPNSTLNPYLDGILQHAFSLGYSRKLRRAQFNAAYQYSFGPQRVVGTSEIIGGDFSNTTMRAQAHIAMLSLLFPF